MRRAPFLANSLMLATLLVLAACADIPPDSPAPGTRTDNNTANVAFVATSTTAPDGQIVKVAGALPSNLPGATLPTATPNTAVVGGSAPPPTTVTGAGGLPTPLPSIPASPGSDGRALLDLPDDVTGLQVHLMYVLPADATDEKLDLNGTLDRSIAASNTWFSGQTGGQKLRIDTYKGQPDITFFKSSKTHAQLGGDNEARLKELEAELQAAGFTHPQKVYALYYGGGAPADNTPGSTGTVELGLGGTGYAAVWIHQCGACALTSDAAKPDAFEYTLVHETLHAMGFVPTCAPHVTADHHTNDDPTDIMAAVQPQGVPVLDPGHNDYYKANIAGCSDLSLSPFLDPRPTAIQIPSDRPLMLAEGVGAVTLTPTVTDATLPGATDLENSMMAALNAARQAAGLPALQLDQNLRMFARAESASTSTDPNATLRQPTGVPGPVGFQGFSTNSANPLQLFTSNSAFASMAQDATLTALGVGVIQAGGVSHITWATSDSKLAVDSIDIGQGTDNTYTVMAQLHTRTGKDVLGNVFLDDGAYVQPFVIRAAGPSRVFVTVPTKGVHKLSFAEQSGAAGHFVGAGDFSVDGSQPVAKALSIR